MPYFLDFVRPASGMETLIHIAFEDINFDTNQVAGWFILQISKACGTLTANKTHEPCERHVSDNIASI